MAALSPEVEKFTQRVKELRLQGERQLGQLSPTDEYVVRRAGEVASWFAEVEAFLVSAIGSESVYRDRLRECEKAKFLQQRLSSGTAALSALSNSASRGEVRLISPAPQTAPLQRVGSICDRFHFAVDVLRTRRTGRKALVMNDEYDVQYLLHAILRLDFDDVRLEEWTPSYAGASARMDFLLKSEKIVVEVKRSRDSLDEKRLGEELIVDVARYQPHPDCKTLVCFVFDPERKIRNPRGIERDLEGNHQSDPVVKVFIRPA